MCVPAEIGMLEVTTGSDIKIPDCNNSVDACAWVLNIEFH